ncbi:DNA methylase [Pseudomonas haemolytica]|uniref:site-specific DNA-methyltransferase (cytosine-N(4)-specific) n=1 Tax=Pseudomonas haemolytica TaxID=2600065 RepID=A0A646P2U6_9PSED|nr:DNA methyltransferase [Pseudomonas haemolytica]MRJ21330.1 DNA methylase [Pseudomonas haemolytica]
MLNIINPKQSTDLSKSSKAFSYYAGYSKLFAESLIGQFSLNPESIILDPWNGGGTTTSASHKLGYNSVGFDLNPVMVLVAKASLVSRMDSKKLLSILHELLNTLPSVTVEVIKEPLEKWFYPSSAKIIRSIEQKIKKFFMINSSSLVVKADDVPPMSAFFYLCLFRVTRKLVRGFVGSNPTWIKMPCSPVNRKRPGRDFIEKMLVEEVLLVCSYDIFQEHVDCDRFNLLVADSRSMPLESESVDAILTSPPYCTRIDYAVATSVELAVLGFDAEAYDILRRSLTGTSTVERTVGEIDPQWGRTCLDFLSDVYDHPSKSSKTYYFKSHIQYYSSIFKSIEESYRVGKAQATMAFVVQNSHYKEVLNDLASIVVEMGMAVGLEVVCVKKFVNSSSMSDLNINSKKYAKSERSAESVIVFRK